MVPRIAVFLPIFAAMTAAAQAWQPDEFPIGFWSGPPVEATSLETWQTVADCNFTFTGPRGGYSVEDNLRMLDFCAQAGVKAMVTDGRIGWQMIADPHWRETVGEVIADYADHPALFGFYLQDEPNYANFEPLGMVREEFETRDPEHLAYINLFPTYANVRQLGTPTYADHVERFLDIVKPHVLSYDHYCLLRDGGIRPDYFENLRIIRDAGLRHGVPPWQIILSLAHLAYRDPTEAEMRWQVYTSLAYGMKGIMYFTYWTPTSLAEQDRFGIVDAEGRPQRLYPIVRQLNAEMRALGPVLLNLTSTGVYHTGEVPRGAMRLGTDAIVQAPEEVPLVIGLFEDAEAAQHMMLVNRDYEQPVEFAVRLLPHVTGVTEISAEDGSEVACELAEGVLAVALPAGGGRLYRLQTQFDYPQPPEFLDRIDFGFDRDGDAEGWSPTHALAQFTVAGGTLSTRVTGADPHMARSFLRVPPDTHSTLAVRMRISAGAREGQVFWATAEEPGFRDDKYLNFPIEPDGEWHEYRLPVSEHAKWRGHQIVALRLDPSVGDADGAAVEIDWIRGE